MKKMCMYTGVYLGLEVFYWATPAHLYEPEQVDPFMDDGQLFFFNDTGEKVSSAAIENVRLVA